MPFSGEHSGCVNQLAADSSVLNVPAYRKLPDVQVPIDDFGCQEADEFLTLIHRDPFCSLRNVPLMSLDRHLVSVSEPGEIRNCQIASARGKLNLRQCARIRESSDSNRPAHLVSDSVLNTMHVLQPQ